MKCGRNASQFTYHPDKRTLQATNVTFPMQASLHLAEIGFPISKMLLVEYANGKFPISHVQHLSSLIILFATKSRDV